MAKKEHEVIVTFNGQKVKLSELSKLETAASEEDNTLNWYLPNEDKANPTTYDEEDYDNEQEYDDVESNLPPISLPKIKKKNKTKKRKKNFKTKGFHFSPVPLVPKKIWMPLFSAIIVGLGLGFTILILFSHQHKPTHLSTASNGSSHVTTNPTTASSSSSAHPTKKVNGSDLGLNTDVVQASAISSLSQAKTESSKLKGKGVPVILAQGSGYYYLFIGVASEKTAAIALGAEYHQAIPSPYIKPWDISAQGVKLPSQSLHLAIQSEQSLLKNMIAVSSEFMVNNSPKNSSLNRLSQSYNQFSKLNYGNVNDKNTQLMAKQLNDTHSLLMASLASPSKGSKRNIQQRLMDAMITYNHLLSSYKN